MSSKTKKAMIVLICVGFSFINAQKIQSRVIGGEKIDSIKGKEYLVSLVNNVDGFYSSYCAGGLISPYYVVTASHCIVDNDIYVFANNHLLPDTQQEKAAISGQDAPTVKGDISKVSRVFYHSDFRDSNNDIAVLKLETPITSPIYLSLPTVGQTKSLIDKNTKMNFAGWGITSPFPEGSGTPPQGTTSLEGAPEGTIVVNEGDIPKGAIGSAPSRYLHSVMTTTLTSEQCRYELLSKEEEAKLSDAKKEKVEEKAKKMMCAGGAKVNEKDKGACSGDSGGPLVYKDGNNHTLIGVASSGVSLCTGIISTSYTKAEYFLDFINKSKQGTFSSDGVLRRGDIEDLPKGWSLVGTEKKIDSKSKIFTNDVDNIYYYKTALKKWIIIKVNNGIIPSDLYIPAKSGFWVYKE